MLFKGQQPEKQKYLGAKMIFSEYYVKGYFQETGIVLFSHASETEIKKIHENFRSKF